MQGVTCSAEKYSLKLQEKKLQISTLTKESCHSKIFAFPHGKNGFAERSKILAESEK